MATLDQEQISLNKELVNIHEVILEAAENRRIAETTKPSISLELNSTSPLVNGDRLHLMNIFYNLIDNAIKYSTGQALIHIETKDAKNGIYISIADQGIGISRADQRKVFDKFYRVHMGNVHNVKGFGLGLSYVKNLVKAHKGSIQLESELNKGSTFILFLPCL
jgi:two-component system phosphate regulon sensor histidine kinase PhoR